MSCRSLPTKKLACPSWLTEMQASFSTKSNIKVSGIKAPPNYLTRGLNHSLYQYWITAPVRVPGLRMWQAGGIPLHGEHALVGGPPGEVVHSNSTTHPCKALRRA